MGLKVYNYFRSGTASKKAVTIYDLKDHHEWNYSYDQLDKILKHLVAAGFISCWKNSKENNKKYYSRIINKDSDTISEGNIYEFVIHDLIDVLTQHVDETDNEVFLFDDFSNKPDELNGFLAVSREDFPFFSDDQFQLIKLIWENYKEQRFTDLKSQTDKEAEPFFIIQVKLLSLGFFLFCLKPQETGASLHFINVNDILDAKIGKAFKMNEDDLKFITKELITLENKQIRTLIEKQV